MADRSITVKIGANVSGFVSGMKTVAQATQDAANKADGWVQNNKQGINEVSNLALGAGVALTGFALVAVNTAATFDAAMSSVQAATMETSSNMELLREAAIQAGADTSFSATEAAAAIEELAKAGLSTADILGGGLAGALDLAASDGIAVAEAAEIASAAMVQFGLSGQDVSHIADLLAAGAGKALGSVSDLGQALNQSGLVASQMGLSIEETAGSLAMFAESGLIGSDAGTSFRSMLLRLANPTKESAQLMEDLGIRAYDAGGQFVGMENLAGQLQDRLGHLTQEQRNQALATIFGQDAIRAAAIAFENGAEGVRTWEAAVNDQGYAAEQAAIRLDNLKGDLEGLSGSIETALIRSGSGANDMLRQLVQSADAVVDAVGGIPEPILTSTTLIAGAGGLGLLGAGALGKLAVSVSDAREAFKSLGVSARTAGIATTAVGGALAIGTLALAAWADSAARAEATVSALEGSLDDATGAITRNTREVVANELTAQQGWWLFKKESGADSARILGLSIETMTDAILGNSDAIEEVRAATQGYEGDMTALSAAAEAAGVSSTDYSNAQRTVREEMERLTGKLGEAEVRNQDLTTAVGEGEEAQEGLAGATDASRSAIERYTEQQQSGIDSTETYTEALQELIDAQREAAGIVLGQREAEVRFEESLKSATDALEKNGKTLDITTEKGRNNRTALDGIAESGWSLIDSMRANGATQDQLQATMQTTRDRFVSMATSMGMGADEANALADELLLIPKDINVNTHIQIDTGTAQAGVDKFIRDNNGRTLTFNVATSGAARVVPGGPNLMKAQGGRIDGPGTGTSDDVPIWASNGEWVIRQRSAAKYGPAFMQAVNDGTYEPGAYANGGEVSYNPRPTLPQYLPVQVSTPAIQAGASYSATVYAQPGADGADLAQRLVYELRTLERGGRYGR